MNHFDNGVTMEASTFGFLKMESSKKTHCIQTNIKIVAFPQRYDLKKSNRLGKKYAFHSLTMTPKCYHLGKSMVVGKNPKITSEPFLG